MLVKKSKKQSRRLSISDGIRYVLKKWPGERIFGQYRFLPIFFCLGAALEFTMINWTVGQTNFYNTFKKRQIQTAIEERAARRAVAATSTPTP